MAVDMSSTYIVMMTNRMKFWFIRVFIFFLSTIWFPFYNVISSSSGARETRVPFMHSTLAEGTMRFPVRLLRPSTGSTTFLATDTFAYGGVRAPRSFFNRPGSITHAHACTQRAAGQDIAPLNRNA